MHIFFLSSPSAPPMWSSSCPSTLNLINSYFSAWRTVAPSKDKDCFSPVLIPTTPASELEDLHLGGWMSLREQASFASWCELVRGISRSSFPAQAPRAASAASSTHTLRQLGPRLSRQVKEYWIPRGFQRGGWER